MTRTMTGRTVARRRRAAQWLAAALLACLAAGTAEARVTWVRKSSTTGDLPVPNEGSQQTCCVVGDFDKDGVTDFAVGERTRTPSVVWYTFNGKGWDRFVVDAKPLKPEAGGDVGDVDGDGDPDILLKPYHHRAPRLDVLLNGGTGK